MFNLAYLKELRTEELQRVMPLFPPSARILELGAGTGDQARLLAAQGFDVSAIDLPSSSYAADRLFPVTDYDGRHIPEPPGSIDVIFSSNVLEHVEDLPAIFAEFRRVLRPEGFGLHIMPTPAWRFWTFVAGVPTAVLALGRMAVHALRPPDGVNRRVAFTTNLKAAAVAILPIGHGTSSEGFSEFWTFSASAWRRKFARYGFDVVAEQSMGLFYTGHMLIGSRMSFQARARLSRMLGSATRIYIVRERQSGH